MDRYKVSEGQIVLDSTGCTLPKNYYRPTSGSSSNYRLRVKEFVLDYKKQHPCRCGESEPACLDFHHRNPKEKLFALNAGVKSKSLEVITVEIAKCILLCANCHRKVHAGLLSLDPIQSSSPA
jgi:hypothetical protein